MPVRRLLTLLIAAVVVAVALEHAVAPPRSAPAYSQRASSTLEVLRSQVQTARLWIEAEQNDRVTRPAAGVAFTEAEEDARSQSGSFAAYDPPDPLAQTEPLRELVTTAGDDTVSLLGEVRVAAATGQWDRMAALAPRLDEAQQRLEQQAAEAARLPGAAGVAR